MADIVDGIPEFESAMNKMIIAVDEAARSFVLKGGAVISKAAKSTFLTGADASITEKWHSDAWPIPTRRTGNLQSSIYTGAVKKLGQGVWQSQTGPHIIYGRRVELGYLGSGKWPHYTTRAFPYMKPGIEKSIQVLDVLFRSLINAAQEA